ncbi:MAG: ABC transporter permease [Fimbriimonas sp.]
MSRYWKIYKTFFTTSLRRELEFRANFFAKIFQNLMWIFFFLAILWVVYSRTDSIAGWTREEAYILAATVFLMNALMSAFFFSLMEIPSHVRMGTLDFIVTKPIDSQFWVSSRKFNFDQIGTLIAGLSMVAYGIVNGHLAPSFLQWSAYVALVVAALVIFYSFNLALMTTGVWLVRVDNLWVLGESVMQIARFPLDIYSAGLQRFLTFMVPLGFLATIPAKQLARAFDPAMAAYGLAWALLAFFLSRRFWQYAMGHYTSASS